MDDNLRSLDFKTEYSSSVLRRQFSRFGKRWGWIFAAGIAYLLLGIGAFYWPVGTTIAMTFTLGALFTISGALQIIQSIVLWKEPGNGWTILQGLVSFAAGTLIFKYPAGGMLGIAIALSFYFFVSAFAKGIVAFGMRPLKGWGWALTSAIVSFFLGAYIVGSLPISAVWLPGLLLSVEFVIYGVSLIGFSFRLRNVHRNIGEVAEENLKRAA